MAPKRKRRGNKRRKGKKTNGLTNVERELYEITIRTLTERLERRDHLIEELMRLKSQFQEKYDQLLEDRNDVVECLKREIEEKMEDIEDLRNDILQIEHLRQADREKWHQDAKMIKVELTNAINELQQENELLSERLDSLEEFRVKKDEIQAYVVNLETKLHDKARQYEEELFNLEKMSIIEHDRLRKELHKKIEKAAEECRQFSEDHMRETVKRAIKETVRMRVELKRVGDTACKLSEENQELKNLENNVKLELKSSYDSEKEMSIRYQSQHDIIKRLKKVCEKYETDQQIIDQLRGENAGLTRTVEKQMEQLESFAINATYLTDKVREFNKNQLKHEFEIETQSNTIQSLSAVIQQSSKCIKQGIAEIPKDEKGQVECLGMRQMMLLQLVEIMDRAADVGHTDFVELVLSQYNGKLPNVAPWVVDEPPLQYQRGDLAIMEKYESPRTKRRDAIKPFTAVVVNEPTSSIKSTPRLSYLQWSSELKPRCKTILSQMGLLVKFERLDNMLQELRTFSVR